jgi:uncharacterized protein YjbI with pentapeptide repeats
MEQANLGGARLQAANLQGTDLEGADLDGAHYNSDTVWPTNFNPVVAGAIKDP